MKNRSSKGSKASKLGLHCARGFAVLLLAAAPLSAATPQAPIGASSPSVVLVTIDTLRADHLEAYGYDKGKTPTITQLANEGILFENAIVQTPTTLPSHASILTGTYPIYHGVQDVVGRLRDGVPTLAEWFKERGYVTAAFVGASVLASQWGLDRGFDYYEDKFSVQGLRQIDFSRVERPANIVVDLANNWIRENRNKPFFLWVHLYDPHDPYTPPEPYATEFREHPYDGEIAFTDLQLGRLLAALKETSIYDQSVVVVTSDHGEGLGEHDEAYHGYFVYEGSLRVPLVFKVPASVAKGRVQPGFRVKGQVRSVDILPTICQLLGERIPDWVQGEGLMGAMTGRRAEVDLPAYAETHYPRIHFGWSPLFSYSNARHKFIEAPEPELYDVKQDPGERANIASQNQGLANQLKEEMHALQRRYALAGGTGPVQEADAETIERLKSLGYVAFSSGSASASAEGLADPKDKIRTYNELNRAIELSRGGRPRQSLDILRQVAEREPQMPIVHFLMGTEFFGLDMFLAAAEQFKETVRLNPESNVARFNLGRSYYRAGLTDQAEETLRELLASDPRHLGARHQLATVLAKRSDFRGAVDQEREVLKLRPDFAEAQINLGSYLLNLGNVDEAIASYLEAERHQPGMPMIDLNLSLAYLRKGDFLRAKERAEKVISRQPESAVGYLYLGQALQGLTRSEDAARAFQRARELDPNLKLPKAPMQP